MKTTAKDRANLLFIGNNDMVRIARDLLDDFAELEAGIRVR